MREKTATDFRRELFHLLQEAALAIPTRIRYKKGDAVLISYEQYRRLREEPATPKKQRSSRKVMGPMISGKILKPLDESASKELINYMNL